MIGIDRDPTRDRAAAPSWSRQAAGRLTLVEGRFSDARRMVARDCGHDAVDGVVLDIGVSSMQLDQAERGFSFRLDGPLDMRMGGGRARARPMWSHAAAERDLAGIICHPGRGAPFARPIARAIVKARADARRSRTTRALADIVGRVVRARPGQIHPATRTFQALRIFVNDELGELAAALAAAERMLKPGGRLVVVSFHSLEDRIVKTFLAERGRTRRRLAPSAGSRRPGCRPSACSPRRRWSPMMRRSPHNPRARSAKLRAAERTDAPAPRRRRRSLLPRLPSLADVVWERADHAPPHICASLALLVVRPRSTSTRSSSNSTLQAERVAKLRADVRRERDAIAALRAEWAQLENPARIQALARRHLTLQPVEPAQFDALDRLPERPPPIVRRRSRTPIAP